MQRRSELLTARLDRLKMNSSAHRPRGELTPSEKTALAPVILSVRRSLEQFEPNTIVRIELSRSEALALSYAFERVEV